MSVTHSVMTGSELHEPKGVASAEAGQIYSADGAGSGAWIHPGGYQFGEMKVTNNSTGLTLTAAGDATLNTNSQYTKVDTGIWTAGALSGTTFDSSGYLTVQHAGIYEISFWSSFAVSVVSTLVAFKFSTNDTNTTLSARKLIRLSGASGDTGNIAASSFATLAVGDKLSMWVVASKNSTVTVKDAGFTCTLLKET